MKLTAQRLKFSIMNFFNKCDQIRRKLRVTNTAGNCGFGHIN